MKLIDLDKAIESMDKLEQEDNEAYGVSIPECFDSNRAIKALNNIPKVQAVPIEVLDKIRAEIDRQHKWLLQAGYTAYNVDIAFDAIKAVMTESGEQV